MILSWSKNAWEDYLYWQQNDKQKLKKINALLKEITRHPFEGTGEPEALKHHLAGYWSRRIDREHRLVYKPTETEILIAQCRFHY